jgi:hypothetical protein
VWASQGAQIAILSLRERTQQVLDVRTKYVSAVRFGASGIGIVVDNEYIRLVDVVTATTTGFRFKDADDAQELAPGVLAVIAKGTVHIVDAKTGKPAKPAIKAKAQLLATSSRGALAAVDWNTKTSATLWVAGKPTKISSWPGAVNEGTAKHPVFSPDGSRFAFIEDSIVKPKMQKDGTWSARPAHVRIVDVGAGREVLDLNVPIEEVSVWGLVDTDRAIVLAPAKRTLASTLCDTDTVVVYTLTLSKKPMLEKQLALVGFDGEPAISAHGVLVNRGLFLERV